MKQLFVTLAAALLLTAGTANAQSNQAGTAAPQQQQPDITKMLEFKGDNYNFGKIPFGKAVTYDVEIKNISKDTIKIENVQAGCGCTTPEWKPGPYAPGETFKVKVGFNGATKGAFSKVVTMYFSGGLSKVITFSGETYDVPADAAPAGPAQKMKPAGTK